MAAFSGSGTEFNAQTRSGNSVVIDTNNRELSPGLYRKVHDQPFGYRKGWSPSMKIVAKGGKKGIVDRAYNVLIPFEYDDILLWTDIPAYYLEVVKNGKHGLIDTNNQVILPCKYDLIRFGRDGQGGMLVGHDQHTAYASHDGRILFDQPGYSAISLPVDSLIVVRALKPPGNTRDAVGVSSLSGRMILSPVYRDVSIKADTITVWKDTLLPADALSVKGDAPALYVRYFSRRMGRFITDWMPPPVQATVPSPVIKTDTQARVGMPFHGGLVFSFPKAGTTWEVMRCLAPAQQFYAVELKASAAQCRLLAVVDTNGVYIVQPFESEHYPAQLNPQDTLLVLTKWVSRDSLTRGHTKTDFNQQRIEYDEVVDRTGRIVLPMQERRLFDAFYWQGKFYAVAAFEKATERFVIRLIGADGNVIKGMEPCYLESYCDRFGVSRDNGYHGFEGFFKVRDADSRRKTGYHIVAIDGQVQFPAIAQAGGFAMAVGDGYFLLTRQTDLPFIGLKRPPEITGFRLVDSNAKEVFKDLPVKQVSRVYDYGYVWLNVPVAHPLLKRTPFYLVYYDNGDDESYQYYNFYMDTKGNAYHGRLKALRRYR